MLDFYVPVAFKANVKTGDLEQKAMVASGVTVGEGVDLGQRTIANLRRNMKIEEKQIREARQCQSRKYNIPGRTIYWLEK
ncbi:hypothetical protein [Acidithiobacillus sulfuriphilus]|uniref:hypothetical protein n=1 Tax=Acidithiobacillus sulfuriphilus TaxID=1867749 RepID=UPI003F628F5D